MTAARALLALVVVLRLVELVHARRNTEALRRRGAVEIGSGHYPLLVLLHALWLASLFVLVPADAPLALPWLALFLALQGARLWVILTLGPWWTTRIMTLPEAPLVRRGPYRFLRHPNYAVVAAEIAVLPMVFGAWRLALIFSLLNALLLGWRIRIEERALAPRRAV